MKMEKGGLPGQQISRVLRDQSHFHQYSHEVSNNCRSPHLSVRSAAATLMRRTRMTPAPKQNYRTTLSRAFRRAAHGWAQIE